MIDEEFHHETSKLFKRDRPNVSVSITFSTIRSAEQAVKIIVEIWNSFGVNAIQIHDVCKPQQIKKLSLEQMRDARAKTYGSAPVNSAYQLVKGSAIGENQTQCNRPNGNWHLDHLTSNLDARCGAYLLAGVFSMFKLQPHEAHPLPENRMRFY